MSGKSGDYYWLACVYGKVGNKAAAEVTLAHIKALAVIAISRRGFAAAERSSSFIGTIISIRGGHRPAAVW
jgi:hypothetical protein